MSSRSKPSNVYIKWLMEHEDELANVRRWGAAAASQPATTEKTSMILTQLAFWPHRISLSLFLYMSHCHPSFIHSFSQYHQIFTPLINLLDIGREEIALKWIAVVWWKDVLKHEMILTIFTNYKISKCTKTLKMNTEKKTHRKLAKSKKIFARSAK